ncbi:MAG: hypothetical protein HFE44_11545 [Oscillospiraceae bacterium]|jgi:tRNA A-37 threonylcarbamoyl transferase component Bud32|nr:hypothetical protein [Oscillospiraceae bacterium]
MTNYETLEIILDQLMNHLHEISADWKFEAPKRGYEREHERTHDMVENIKDMMERCRKAEAH